MLEFRNDDVLQKFEFSRDQQKAFSKKTPFEWFLEADKPFAEYDYPCTLAVMADGLQVYPEWVKYIKDNIHRYKIELHGYFHTRIKDVPQNIGFRILEIARNLIEEEFGQQITTWYVPFGRSNIPDWGDEVCEKLEIKMDRPTEKTLPYFWQRIKGNQLNFHYWDKKQILQVKHILEAICQPKNTK